MVLTKLWCDSTKTIYDCKQCQIRQKFTNNIQLKKIQVKIIINNNETATNVLP